MYLKERISGFWFEFCNLSYPLKSYFIMYDWLIVSKKMYASVYKSEETYICFLSSCCLLQVLVVGSGPCGLRMAIECAFLGAKTVIIEKRDSFSRNNVLHLWPFLINDLRNLGAKKFFGKFCAGAIDHISECLSLFK